MRFNARTHAVAAMATAALFASTVPAASADQPSFQKEAAVDEAIIAVGQSVDEEQTVGLESLDRELVSAKLSSPAGEATISAHDAEDSVIKTRSDGVQLLTVLHDGETTADFTIDLPEGAGLVPDGSGGFNVVVDEDSHTLTIGNIDAPWAVDANGDLVDTNYTLSGDTLTQEVRGADLAYPVVADPRFTYGRGIYLNVTGLEAKLLAAATVSTGGAAAVAICSGATKLPAVPARIAAGVCTAVGAPTLAQVINSIQDIATSVPDTACLQSRIAPGSRTEFVRVSTSNCADL